MSVKAMNWAWDVPGLSTAQRVVLVKLADSADGQRFQAWPSIPFLAEKCCLSERQVMRIVVQLEERQLVTRVPWLGRDGRGKGRRNESTYLYTLRVTQERLELEPAPDNLSPGQNVTPDIGDTEPLTSEQPAPDIGDTEPLTSSRARAVKEEPTAEPTTEPTTENPPDGAAAAGAAASVHKARREFHWYQQTWNNRMQPWGLSRVDVMNNDRKRHIRAREREAAFDWNALLTECEALCEAQAEGRSVFILERGLLDFDFLIKNQKGYTRLLEGRYRPPLTAGPGGAGAGAPVESGLERALSYGRGTGA